jgi:hypothetical protein
VVRPADRQADDLPTAAAGRVDGFRARRLDDEVDDPAVGIAYRRQQCDGTRQGVEDPLDRAHPATGRTGRHVADRRAPTVPVRADRNGVRRRGPVGGRVARLPRCRDSVARLPRRHLPHPPAARNGFITGFPVPARSPGPGVCR